MAENIAERTEHRTLDRQGRLSLGPEYKHALVILLHRKNGEVVVKPAKAVPAEEAWAHEGDVGSAIKEGLAHAKSGKLGTLDLAQLEADAELFGEDE